MEKVWKNRKDVDMHEVFRVADELGITPELAMICKKRDYSDLRNFLFNIDQYKHDAHLLADFDKGLDLICSHIEKKSKVAICNDYDVDGITSGYIACNMLSHFGIEAIILTPNRITEAYGMNARMIEEAHRFGASLIITTDNGISCMDEIARAKELGMDVVITDHHEVALDENGNMILPNADAIINPKRTDGSYPFREICGANVIFKVAEELLSVKNLTTYANMSEKEADDVRVATINQYVELVGIATIADVMPLENENRMYVRYALSLLKRSAFVGFRMLCAAQKVSMDKLTSDTLAFQIIPCLNAVSRMTGESKLAIDLFSTKDNKIAEQIAGKLVSLNEERKKLSALYEQSAVEMINENDQVICVCIKEALHTLCGIVAGQLKERYYKPSLVCSVTEDGDYVGSGRSIEEFSMIERLREHGDLFEKLGGHALACGFRIKPEQFEELKRVLNEEERASDFKPSNKKEVDIFIDMSNVRSKLIEEMDLLEPFGMGNNKPVFVEENAVLVKIEKMGAEKQYRRYLFENKQGIVSKCILFRGVDAIEKYLVECFGTDCLSVLEMGRGNYPVDVCYNPGFNTFNGQTSIQYMLVDVRKGIENDIR